jgi:putative phosphoribosyl transferase
VIRGGKIPGNLTEHVASKEVNPEGCEMLFDDRADAGRQLSSKLHQFVGRDDVLVLALPRGGVPVGFEIASALRSALDVLVVRKLGAPGQEELAMGAIASDQVVMNPDIVRALNISARQIEERIAYERRELERREQLYRGGRLAADIRGHIVILVDDGAATGSTMRVAMSAIRQQNPAQIIVAVPVASKSVCVQLEQEADRPVFLYTPVDFYAVGQWYRNFTQIGDAEVRELLDRATKPTGQRVA